MATAGKRSGFPWGLVLAVGAFVLILAVLHFSPTVRGLVEAGTDWAKDIMQRHPVGGAAVFFGFSALSPMLALVSSAVLVPPAVEAWGKPLTFILLWAGWTTGVMMAYGIGRLAMPVLIRLGYGKKLQEYRDLVSRRLKFRYALLICIGVPSEIPGYLFGAVHYPFLKFLAAAGIAELIYALGMVIAGDKLLEAETPQLFFSIGAMVVVLAVAGFYVRRLRKNKHRAA